MRPIFRGDDGDGVRRIAQRVVVDGPFAGLDAFGFAGDGDHCIADTVQFLFWLRLGRFDHQGPGHRPRHCWRVESVIDHPFGDIVDGEAGVILNRAGVQDALVGNWESTPLSDSYFSKENMELLQNGIRAGVYKKSDQRHIIGLQDCDTLRIIMRSIFLQFSGNMKDEITKQLEALNMLVLNYSIPQVFGELEGYIRYREDVSKLPVPLAMPTASSYRTNTLELKKWF